MYKLIERENFLPVTLDEAAVHCRIDNLHDDARMETIIKAAAETIENLTGQVLTASEYEMLLKEFPPIGQPLKIYRCPVVSIESVKYLDETLTEQTMDKADFVLHETEPATLSIKPNKTYPVTGNVAYNVKITFLAGHNARQTIPAPLKQAMLLLINHYYDNPTEVVIGRQVNQLPKAAEFLIAPYMLKEL